MKMHTQKTTNQQTSKQKQKQDKAKGGRVESLLPELDYEPQSVHSKSILSVIQSHHLQITTEDHQGLGLGHDELLIGGRYAVFCLEIDCRGSRLLTRA